jgi:signal transduction histidine kinase
VLSAEASLTERVLEHIAEIGSGKCSITNESIEAEPDPSAQQILAGLLMLHEDLQYAQQRQSALLDDLRDAVRARDEFLSVASHELRTPITTLLLQIDGLSRMLRDQLLPPLAEKVGRRIDVTRRQVDRLAALVSALIDVSRIASGRMQLTRQLADMVEIARSVAERLNEDAVRSGSTITFQRQGPVWGNFDVSRVDQVLTNLLTNAIRYGRGKPIAVGVAAQRETALFWVEDQGIGIPPEAQARIFQRYERAAPSTSYAGLGLGLWISRQLVEAMGGTIAVTSEPDVGSKFTVELPRAG